MKATDGIGLADVQQVYSGPEGRLWELIMGEQIHIGGLPSSTDLAESAGIKPEWHGVDFCCCSGAGMRFLVRFLNVAKMTGVDATETMVELGKKRCEEDGLQDRIAFVQADVCDSGLPDASADFVWGEDAWCYVTDKEALCREAARIVKPGGIIAFTDWVEGPTGLTDEEAERFLRFMKFPNMADLDSYQTLLQQAGCEMVTVRDTKRFQPHIELYISMLEMQLGYDALKIVGFDQEILAGLGAEMHFTQELAAKGKLIQGLFVARKKA